MRADADPPHLCAVPAAVAHGTAAVSGGDRQRDADRRGAELADGAVLEGAQADKTCMGLGGCWCSRNKGYGFTSERYWLTEKGVWIYERYWLTE